MQIKELRRRSFLKKTMVGAAGMHLAARLVVSSDGLGSPGKPAILGGKPVRTDKFPLWPVIQDNDERAWIQVLRAKGWFRMNGDYVKQFEKEFAQMMGAKDCLATANGTRALHASLNALGIGPAETR